MPQKHLVKQNLGGSFLKLCQYDVDFEQPFCGYSYLCYYGEATLEFLGFGDPLSTTWGVMLFNAQNSAALRVGGWWELLGPCLGLVMLGAGLT